MTLLRVFFGDLKLSFVQKLRYILGDMNHLEVHLELGILVLEGMVAMGGGDQDLLHPAIDKGLDVLLGQRLNTSSSPVLRMLSPQQLSLAPRMPKLTPALLRILAVAAATFFSLGS